MEDLYFFDVNDFNQGLKNEIDINLDNAELFGATELEKLQVKKESCKNYILKFLYQIKNILDKLSSISLANIILTMINLGVDFDDEEFQYWINIFELQYLNRLNNLEPYQQSDLENLLNILQKVNPNFGTKKLTPDLDYKEYYMPKMNDFRKNYTKNISQTNFKNEQKPNTKDIQLINMLRGILKVNNKEQKQLEERIQKQIIDELNKQNKKLFEKKQLHLKNQEIIYQEFSNKKNRKTAMKVVEEKNKPIDEKEIKKLKLKMIAKKGR